MTPAKNPSLIALADGADRLYSLPAVAMEVLRLTEEPTVDGRALCDALESDPALAAKLLRVVNSSLYGLPQEIASLPQAIALVGIRPLKLLVLGFALPERLYEGLAGDALRRYWTENLTTAAAARAVAETGWGRLGDEALVAGLLQGLGQLTLVQQLGDDYSQLLESTAAKPLQPARSVLPLEREALGFEHPELSAELVRRWRLPERLAEAIESQSRENLDHLDGDQACLAQSLWLANRLTALVAGGDLSQLGIILREGDAFCGLTNKQVNAIVETLQQRVGQLAHAMSVELREEIDYRQTLIEAHAQMALLSEQSAVRLMGEPRSVAELEEDDHLARELLTETNRLSAAVRVFLAGGTGPRSDDPEADDRDRARPSGHHLRPATAVKRQEHLETVAREACQHCREKRLACSLSQLALTEDGLLADADVTAFRQWLGSTPLGGEFADAVWAPSTRDRCAVLLPGADRIDAARLWSEVGDLLIEATPLRLNAGVAGVDNVPRGFDPRKLIEAADRCLDTSLAGGGASVKSIEVF